jgi:hypothetical protein
MIARRRTMRANSTLRARYAMEKKWQIIDSEHLFLEAFREVHNILF